MIFNLNKSTMKKSRLYIKPEITNEWTIEQIVKECPPKGWSKLFEETYDDLSNISEILKERELTYGHFVPDKKNLFRAFEITPLKKVKIVILGQDPYQTLRYDGTPVAQGLSFSIKKGDKLQPSILNIFKEIKNEILDFEIPDHGDLTNWAKQGVFLLNSALTTDKGISGAHSMPKSMLWNGFITKVFEYISRVNPNCIYFLWGKNAQKFEQYLGEKSIIFKCSHPSGYSADRGFFGCGHFKKANKILIEQGKEPIDWNLF